MEAPLWNIEAIGNYMALELWRLISQTGTDLAVSLSEFIFFLINFVVVIDDRVIEKRYCWRDCHGLKAK